MSDAILERMVRPYMATPQPQYAFGWQGGEPTLMGLEFFRRVTELQQRHGRAGAVVSNGLQTNGTLLDEEFARHLAAYNFLVGVSVDGPAELHDRHRVRADGHGSHESVMQGIRTMRRHGVEFNVLTLVNSANVSAPETVYHYLCELGVLYHQYIECVEFDEAGGLRPFAVTGGQWGEFLCRIFDVWFKHDTRRVSIRLFDSVLSRMVDGVANVCQMGRDCRQYLVVEHNGDIYPCDFFVEPELKLGNVLEGSWEEFLDAPVYAEFGRRKAQWNASCDACPYLRFCAGDCQKNRFRAGRDPRQLSHLCEGWKLFYGHTIARFRKLAAEIQDERARSAAAARADTPPPSAQKVGRNQPCPCGSGRKYKHCCGR
jgi:uncharacterized protein